MKTKLAIVICVILIVTLLAACNSQTGGGSDQTSSGSSASETTDGGLTLVFLCTTENYSSSVQEFMEDYEMATGNKVEVQFFPETEYDQVIRARQMSNQNFDLYRTGSISFSEFQWPTDWPYRLNDRPWIDRLAPAAVSAMSWGDGSITGIPINNNGAEGMMYNKKIFAEAGIDKLPETWTEFLDACEKIKQIGVIPVNIQLASGHEYGTTFFLYNLFVNVYLTRGVGGANELFAAIDANEITFGEVPEYLVAINQLLELRDKGYINEDFITTTFEMSQENFAFGKVAMHPCGDFVLDPLSEYPELDLNNDIGFFPLPYQDTPGAFSLYSGVGLTINSKSENLDAAIELMDMFASKEAQDKYMAKNPGNAAFSDAVSESTAFTRGVDEFAEKGLAFRDVCESHQLFPDTEFRGYLQELMLGSITAEQLLDKLQSAAEMIAKSKGLPGW